MLTTFASPRRAPSVRRRAIVALACTVALACSDSKAPTSPGGNNGGNETAVTALIDGQSWTSDAGAHAQADAVGRLTIVAARKTAGGVDETLTIVLGYVTGPGTYQLGVSHVSNSGGTATFTRGSAAWNTPLSGASGSVTISAVNATRLTGTFQFTAAATPPATTTKTISIGTFDVPFKTTFTLSQERGSTVSATINGTAWNAANIAPIGTGTSFGFQSSNLSYVLTLAPQDVVSGATYPLGTGQGRALITVSLQAGSGVTGAWGGGLGDIGSVTITSASARRVTGTFSGTLLPQALPGQSPMIITNGEFDVRTAP